LEICAYVIMSSHVHMIIERNVEPLNPVWEGIIRGVKKYTSTKIIQGNSRESAGKQEGIVYVVISTSR
jgi:REP element-mobilizing transposase RayT